MSARRQSGFVLGIAAYAAIAAFVVISGMGIALKVQNSRLATCKQEFQAFQARVEAEGKAAEAEAKRINSENQAKKAKYDKEIKVLRASNANLSRRVRDSAGQSSLPAPATGAGQSQTACFNRGILDDAIRAFTAGTAAIATEGQQAADELANAKAWAQGR